MAANERAAAFLLAGLVHPTVKALAALSSAPMTARQDRLASGGTRCQKIDLLLFGNDAD